MRNTFNLGFVCRPSKANKLGLAPVELTININKERTYLTLQRRENPDQFKKKLSQVRKNELKDYLNEVIDRVQGKILEMMKQGIPVSSEGLKEFIKNGCTNSFKVSDLFKEYFDLLIRRVGIDLTLQVYRKYEIVRDQFLEFSNDPELKEVTSGMISSFYVNLNQRYYSTTSAGMMTKLKTVFIYAFNNGMISHNPFGTVRITKRTREVEFLTEDEISRIQNYRFSSNRLSNVRDLFLFQCFTGLSYIDMANLQEEDFRKNSYNQIFIHKERIKTGVSFTTVLMEDALKIAEKHNYRLPVLSNQKYNSYLKEIADLCNINKSLHSHTGRHTAATYLLNKGISIETVSKILGHSNIKQTQHYAKLIDKTVFDAIDKIS